jgi:glycosyltransferase involved in cell wall biosynthesis
VKIACISTSRVPSETANSIQVMKASHALARLGHAVHLIVPGPVAPAPGWDALAEKYGLSVPFQISWAASRPKLRRIDFAWTAVRLAAGEGADLVYTWTGQSAVFSLLHHLPVIYELHDRPTGAFGPVWFRAFLGLKGRKRIGVITKALRSVLQEQYRSMAGVDCVVAPNGVDLEPYSDRLDAGRARRELGLPETLTVMCSGHLYAGRGADLFLSLARRFPQVSFVWVGGRPADVQRCQIAARASGLSNVIFTGFVSQRKLPCWQAAADILLMPYARSIAGSSGGNSADICSPMKMFDYLAAGRAILSSDLPVIHEVLHDGNARFAVPEDTESWSSELHRLLADPDLRGRLAAQARKDVVSYSWQARAKSVLTGFD